MLEPNEPNYAFIRSLQRLGVCSLPARARAAASARPIMRPRRRRSTAPNYKESTVNFHDTEGWKVASPQDAMIRGNWWEVFNEPELNALEEQLNINNQNLKQYFQNYMAARAVIAEARSQYWPTITANPSWNRSRTSATRASLHGHDRQDLRTLESSDRCLVDAGLLGQDPQRGPRGAIRRAGERRRSRNSRS